jgi:hypothetical protein
MQEAKALGLTTQYDPKIDIPQTRAVSSRPLNPDQDGPDVQFVFTYATRGECLSVRVLLTNNVVFGSTPYGGGNYTQS